jgi:ribosomal subunit interface protein
MRINVTGKQLDVGDALRSHVEDKLSAVVEKYFDRFIDAHVTIAMDGPMFRADLSVHVGTGIKLQSHEEGGDAYAAFELALEKMDKRLRRYKRRVRNHHDLATRADAVDMAAQSYVLAAEDEHEIEPETLQPVIVAETSMSIPALSVGEAVMHMDLGDLPVLMFQNRATGSLNVVYRRKDGNVGWIEPDGAAQTAVAAS